MTKLIQLRRLSVPVILLLVFSTLAIIILATGNRTHPFSRLSKPSGPKGANSQQLVENYGKLPLSFEANQGQAGPGVAFLSRGSGYTLFLTGDEAVLALRSQEAKVKSQKRQWRVTSDKWRVWSVELRVCYRFLDPRPSTLVTLFLRLDHLVPPSRARG